MTDKRCNVCGKQGNRRVLFRYYRGGPWLCKDEGACYSRRHLAWALENFEENERVQLDARIARRKAAIAQELARRPR